MGFDEGRGHGRGARCPVCASILAAARGAKTGGRPDRRGVVTRRARGGKRADRIWEAALLGHLQLVPGTRAAAAEDRGR